MADESEEAEALRRAKLEAKRLKMSLEDYQALPADRKEALSKLSMAPPPIKPIQGTYRPDPKPDKKATVGELLGIKPHPGFFDNGTRPPDPPKPPRVPEPPRRDESGGFGQAADKAVLGLCELLGLLFALPFGEDLYHDTSITGSHILYLCIGVLFAVAGPMWPLMRRRFPKSRLVLTLGSAATDARIWIILLLAFFLGGNITIPWAKPPVIWSFDDPTYKQFLQIAQRGNGEPLISSIVISGQNISKSAITDFSGYARSDLTNEVEPFYINAEDDSGSSGLPFPPMIPTPPDKTYGIPPSAAFRLTTNENPNIQSGVDGLTLNKFLSSFGAFTIVLKYAGTTVERHFSADDITEQMTLFKKGGEQLDHPQVPRVMRKPQAPSSDKGAHG